MTDHLPVYVPAVFLTAVFFTVAVFWLAVLRTTADEKLKRIIIAIVPLWMLIQAGFAISGLYQTEPHEIPLLIFLGPLPALIFFGILFATARSSLISDLPLKLLTIIHVVRIPVELVLHWLYEGRLVPEAMTFSGANFDILSGLTAALILFLAFRGGTVNRVVLVAWNIAALLLVLTIVTIAILSFPGPLQQLSPELPNRAVALFPYIWLPSVIVPIVIFSHAASLYKLLTNNLK
ncbi:MAG TPA: hypothetical protein VK918_05775 [Pyrinomonadaceae bacterium]|nr:hypothetical protein [Pyrinomonadaceae bacterium]